VLLTPSVQSRFLRGVKVEGAGTAEVGALLLRFVRVKNVALQRSARVSEEAAFSAVKALLVYVRAGVGVVVPCPLRVSA
jgi:hypothetical protein